MPFRNQILGFLIRFVVVFGLLIFPSPAWNELYGKGFRAVGNAVFARDDEKCVLYFEGHRQTQGFSAVDTRINIGNRHLVDNNGKGPAAFLVLNTRSVGWLPTALTVALIVATPVPWWRRCWALLWGVLLDQRLCPIFGGRLYLERIDHCFARHVFTILEGNRRCSRIHACHANGDQFFHSGASLDRSAIPAARC